MTDNNDDIECPSGASRHFLLDNADLNDPVVITVMAYESNPRVLLSVESKDTSWISREISQVEGYEILAGARRRAICS